MFRSVDCNLVIQILCTFSSNYSPPTSAAAHVALLLAGRREPGPDKVCQLGDLVLAQARVLHAAQRLHARRERLGAVGGVVGQQHDGRAGQALRVPLGRPANSPVVPVIRRLAGVLLDIRVPGLRALGGECTVCQGM